MARRDDYGKVLPTRRWQGAARPPWWKRWFYAWRYWLLAALVIGAMVWFNREVPNPPELLNGPGQQIYPPFTLCSARKGRTCVVDGDTIIVGERHIRIIGIDAPETHEPHCVAEAQKGAAATRELLRLMNQGPVTIQGREQGLHDEYGRELMSVYRIRSDGSVQLLGDDMVASGHAHRFTIGMSRGGWCD